MLYAPMTELEAVNSMLEIIGEQPVNTLTNTGIPEVEAAKTVLHRVNREVQAWKLHANTEKDYTLPLNGSGQIDLPTNTLNVDATDLSLDVVARGTRLYDLTNHTYSFAAPVKVTITLFLPFEELPDHARNYIAIRAGRQYQVRYLGSSDIHSLTEKDEAEALREFRRTELANRDISMLDNPSVYNVLRRYL